MNLDIQVAMGAAPDAHWRTYIAPNNLAILPTMLAKMRAEHVTVVSDSWGLCELFVPIRLTAAENTALELLAANGVSFYVASGDDGAADCRAANPDAKFLAIDDPSGSPFATAVGGTNLKTGPRVEKAWKGSGGGISINYPKPGFQRGGRTQDVPGSFCSSGKAQCRVTPGRRPRRRAADRLHHPLPRARAARAPPTTSSAARAPRRRSWRPSRPTPTSRPAAPATGSATPTRSCT